MKSESSVSNMFTPPINNPLSAFNLPAISTWCWGEALPIPINFVGLLYVVKLVPTSNVLDKSNGVPSISIWPLYIWSAALDGTRGVSGSDGPCIWSLPAKESPEFS